jgi:hypothetical protein
MDDLARLAELIKTRNAFENDIARIVGRPAQMGHLGEYIAARVFTIELEESAAHKGSDGRFTGGPLAGRTVNIKWYAKLEGMLDVNPEAIPDYYLVLAGPRVAAASSRATVRPWLIESAFLFDAEELVGAPRRRGVKLGIATSVARQYWDEAEVYPSRRNHLLTLSGEQRRLLSLFGEGPTN